MRRAIPVLLGFVRNIHNRRPLLWSVLAFVIVVLTATVLSIWWNVLLVQNHRILSDMTAAAQATAGDAWKSSFPLALLMVLGILCSLVLVTGLLYMFLRLIKALQLNLAQSQFIAAVTHELRSPVASLQISLETIRDETTSPERKREFTEAMAVDLRRLRTLVDQVLDTARLENFVSAVSREDVAVGKVFRSCHEYFETQLKATSGTLDIGQVPERLTVVANRQLLLNALVNIVDNALKYSAGPARVRLSAEDTGRGIVLEVSDHGIGISRAEQKRIFRRFYRAGDPMTRDRPGTGLGLYFARLAIQAQGGRLSVHSAGPGQGSTFRIELPRKE